jgi:hypothetical protein
MRPLKPAVGQQHMSKKYLLSIFLIPLFTASTIFAGDCPLKGKWKSNEKLTLGEMKKDKDLSKRQVDFLSNNFFGKLIVEFTCNELTSYYEGEITKKEYKIIKRDGNYITIRYFENGLGEDCDYTIELAGGCYYIPLPILKFREVMCRIKE